MRQATLLDEKDRVLRPAIPWNDGRSGRECDELEAAVPAPPLHGGRDGYDTLLNTDLAREKRQFGRFLQLVVEHKHRIGFKGAILIEPKPREPTKHQYDFDVETVYGFLVRNGLEKEVKVNIEANHATLAMYYILQGGGFTTGGNNFDAQDLFSAHIGGIDILARGLLNAAELIEDGQLHRFVRERYKDWDAPAAAAILMPGSSLAAIADEAVSEGVDPRPRSGRQELLENLVSRFT